jgi:hypothetical protein
MWKSNAGMYVSFVCNKKFFTSQSEVDFGITLVCMSHETNGSLGVIQE